MIEIRRGDSRGATRLAWLDSRHTFSFGEYYDPQHMGFRRLRVINDDRVRPAAGFPTHAHRDMEIVTYVLDGALEHRDSLGNGSVIRPGEIQRMSAGTGIQHSEFNASKDAPVHFLQIWIEPAQLGIPPGYEQRAVPAGARERLALIGSSDGRDGSVTIHQDVRILGAQLSAGAGAEYAFAPGRYGWLHVARGQVTVNGTALGAGDGAAFSAEPSASLRAVDAAEVLLFDLA
jgi:redox-sensitive bicupin YhaK (pirin superfamily)